MGVIYKVVVYTGNRLEAGTSSYIDIKFEGPQDESDEKCLDSKPFSGFHKGKVKTIQVHCKKALWKLISVHLRSEPFWHLHDQWFCDKLVIITPEGYEILFPCYRWLATNEKFTLKTCRRWSVYAQGIPRVINYERATALPSELQFSFAKEVEFGFTAAKQIVELKLLTFSDCKKTWENFEQLDSIISGDRSAILDYVQDHWEEDKFFGYQFLNGLNPMMIKRCTKLPDNFPVTEEMVVDFLHGKTLEHEMKKGKIFLCDYKMLDKLIGNVVDNEQQFLTAPLVLLHCNHHGDMMPIAIQLMQKPGPDNPIFLPTDSKYDWLLAKIFVRAAEFSVHELDFHLLRTHLLCEVFTVATLRQLPAVHPLYKLLYPHTRYTLQINIMARNQLISDEGVFQSYAGVGGDELVRLLRRATKALTYSSLCLPENITGRGLTDVPNYFYRDDAMKLWKIINKYVAGMLQHYYTSDEDVTKDGELQKWIQEIFENGFLERSETGIPQSFQTVADLIKFVTMVIFTASAQHAAVNNGQFDFGGFMPNYPMALRRPPPKEKGHTTEKTILETLPTVSTTVHGMAVLKLLSTKSSDHYPLGDFPEELFDEKVPCKLMKDFQADLNDLSFGIKKRNNDLSPQKLPYSYLNPENVDNSVAI